MRFDRKTFFSGYRQQFGSLKQEQVAALEQWLSFIENDATVTDVRHAAYMTATCGHETAFTFEPITERGSRAYFDKYNAGTRIGHRLGNTQPGDGYLFRGRGYVQITGRSNYSKFSSLVDRDLLAHPDSALDPQTAYRIATIGMRRGRFTGKKLVDYIDGSRCNYFNARRIINGTDQAGRIADYAEALERILRSALTQDAPRNTQTESQAPEPSPSVQDVEQVMPDVPVAPAQPAPAPLPLQEAAVPVPAVAVSDTTSKKSLWATITGGLGLTALGGYFDTIKEHADDLKNIPHDSSIIKIVLIAVAAIVCLYIIRQIINGVFDRWAAFKHNQTQLHGAQSPALQTAVLVAPPAVAVSEEKS